MKSYGEFLAENDLREASQYTSHESGRIWHSPSRTSMKAILAGSKEYGGIHHIRGYRDSSGTHHVWDGAEMTHVDASYMLGDEKHYAVTADKAQTDPREEMLVSHAMKKANITTNHDTSPLHRLGDHLAKEGYKVTREKWGL